MVLHLVSPAPGPPHILRLPFLSFQPILDKDAALKAFYDTIKASAEKVK